MSNRNSVICRYYTRGICSFGDRCRFLHPTDINDSIVMNHQNVSQQLPTIKHDDKIQRNTNWANAPIFVPKSNQINDDDEDDDDDVSIIEPPHDIPELKTYAEIVGGGISDGATATTSQTLCPFQMGCPYGIYCKFLHGELCEMCSKYCLHPYDKENRRKHIQECIHQHEKDMELSFAIARSQNKTCGICFDTILEKQGRERRFGILPNCNHIFCLECIRKWRQAKQFENKITRSCPECRITSDFVCPSAFWVDTKDEKDKLITDYKHALGDKDCKYFNKGKGKCPFGNKCFYKHALANGKKVDVGQPPKGRKVFPDVGIMDLFSDISLYRFIDSRELPSSWIEFIADFHDSDDSDSSDDALD